MELENQNEKQLYADVCSLVSNAKSQLAQSANASLTLMYWKIGERINNELLDGERAEYGKQIVVSLARQLTIDFGKSFEEKNLRRMIQFAQVFHDEQIVVSLIRQLSWTHFIALIPIKDELKPEFYAMICQNERWN